MGNFRLEAKVHGRTGGKGGVVAAAAYRSAERLSDHGASVMGAVADRAGERLEAGGEVHDFTRKRGVVATEMHLPMEAPAHLEDRGNLWRAVEARETRINSRLAREAIVSIPRELSHEQGIDAVRGFVNEQIVAKGAAADVCFHDVKARDGGRNFHAHVLYTTREVGETGLGAKIRAFDRKAHVVELRAAWADHANYALEQAGRHERVDCRSLKDQAAEALEKRDFEKLAKVDREPTLYLSRTATQMEQRGKTTPMVERKREVEGRNAIRAKVYERLSGMGERARGAFLAARERVGDALAVIRQGGRERGASWLDDATKTAATKTVERSERSASWLDDVVSKAATKMQQQRQEREHGHDLGL